MNRPLIRTNVFLKIAGPMAFLAVVLLALGVVAAWKVNELQQTNSDMLSGEVREMIAVQDFYIDMREIRYQVNMYLRTHNIAHLDAIDEIHGHANELLAAATKSARGDRVQELTTQVSHGYDEFFSEFQEIRKAVQNQTAAPDVDAALTRLADNTLTDGVLQPCRESFRLNQEFVERTDRAASDMAKNLRMGFLALGICGAIAGLLMGLAIARTIGRSIVQFNVSVRGIAHKLAEGDDAVTFTRTGDLDDIGVGLQMLESDISESLQRLQQRELELLRGEQLSQLGQLAAGVAHELRNPLMPIKLLVQAAMERGSDGRIEGDSLEVINDEICRLEDSVQSFLEFARPTPPEPTRADVVGVVRRCVELVGQRAEQQGVAIHFHAPVEELFAEIDSAQLRQVMLNLLLNSLDAMNAGGVLDVECGPNAALRIDGGAAAGLAQCDATALSRGATSVAMDTEPDCGFTIRVADDGTGIPPDIVERIFSPFVTTKDEGTGLGLSICERIVRSHRGTIRARNRRTGGAEFEVCLPGTRSVVP